jgi:hypothetical protein
VRSLVPSKQIVPMRHRVIRFFRHGGVVCTRRNGDSPRRPPADVWARWASSASCIAQLVHTRTFSM